VAAAALAVLPPLALALVVSLKLDRVPPVPFFVGGAVLEVVAMALAVWGIVRASRGGGLLWLAVVSLIVAVPAATFFGLGVAFSFGYTQG
jgi:hypothetical protein